MRWFFLLFFFVNFIDYSLYCKDRFCYLTIISGKNYNQNAKIGILSFKTIPQIAFWIESEDGSFKKTIYITKRFAKQIWNGFYDKNKTFREYALPLWCKRFKEILPTYNKPLSDSVTMASPKSDSTFEFLIPEDKVVILFLEVNNSFDYNDSYPEDQSYNGQPSLIYTAKIPVSFKGKIELKLTYKTDFNGNVFTDLNNITTAKDILKRVEVEIK